MKMGSVKCMLMWRCRVAIIAEALKGSNVWVGEGTDVGAQEVEDLKMTKFEETKDSRIPVVER
jgi:hypothetical protein